MKLREQSTIGWMMLGGLGSELVPGVFKPELFPAPAMQGRRSGKMHDLHAPLHPAQRRFFESVDRYQPPQPAVYRLPTAEDIAIQWQQFERDVAMAKEMVLAPEPEVQTYRTDSSLWWLSWADDTHCAGIAIVRVDGEQNARAAAAVAEGQGLVPAGAWQLAAFQVPEEQRATHEPFVGRFLTTTEAAAAFAAQSIKNYEAEHGVEIDTSDIEVVG